MTRIVIGVSFLLFGLGAGGALFCGGLYMVGSASLTCQRVESNQVNCTITEYHGLGLVHETTQLNQVQKARDESYSCSTGTGKKKRTSTCHNLVIQTQSGEVRPTFFLGTGLVNEMNQFLASAQPTWTYKTGIGESLLWSIFGVMPAMAGAVVGPVCVLIGLFILELLPKRQVQGSNK